MKKYTMIVRSEDGYEIFHHSSDSAERLAKLYRKEAFFSDGNMSSAFYGRPIETNIPMHILNELGL